MYICNPNPNPDPNTKIQFVLDKNICLALQRVKSRLFWALRFCFRVLEHFYSECVVSGICCLVCGFCGRHLYHIFLCFFFFFLYFWSGLYDFVFFLFAAWLRCVCEVGRKCAGGDTAFQFVYVNIYVLISNNATSEILMKYKQNVSVLHTHTHTGTHTHPAPHSWYANSETTARHWQDKHTPGPKKEATENAGLKWSSLSICQSLEVKDIPKQFERAGVWVCLKTFVPSKIYAKSMESRFCFCFRPAAKDNQQLTHSKKKKEPNIQEKAQGTVHN